MGNEHYLTEQDYELLSAYLDGELSPTEQASLEARLQAEPFLRQELYSLRQTIALIRQLAVLRAPRDFTLDASMLPAKKVIRPRSFLASGMFSALSTAAAVVLMTLGLVLYSQEEPLLYNMMPPADTVVSQISREAPVVAMQDMQQEIAAPPPALIGGAVMPPVDSERARSVAPDETLRRMEDSASGAAAADTEELIQEPPVFAAVPQAIMPLFEGDSEALGGIFSTQAPASEQESIMQADAAVEAAVEQYIAPPPAAVQAPLPEQAVFVETESDLVDEAPVSVMPEVSSARPMETIALSLIFGSIIFFIVAAISGFFWWRQGAL